MRKRMAMVLFVLCLSMLFVGCTDAEQEEQVMISYEQISQEEANALMESETDYVILDVRTEEEFAEGYIAGAILIPNYAIKEKAESMLPDKDQLILVYCRSGRRSKLAASELVTLGYTNVKEFGGIIDWSYGIVKD